MCSAKSDGRKDPGELSFVPPDGKFVLASYEVDLIPGNTSTASSLFQLPITLNLKTLLGTGFTEFEVRLSIPGNSPYFSSAQTTSSTSPGFRMGGQAGGGGAQRFEFPTSAFSGHSTGTSTNPTMEDISIVIPLPPAVKSLINVKTSKGQILHDTDGTNHIVWKIPTSGSAALSPGSVATLRAEVVPKDDGNDDDEDEDMEGSNFEHLYEITSLSKRIKATKGVQNEKAKPSGAAISAMPRSALLNFTIRGALLSGLKVDSLKIVGGKGLVESVKPYKGVKYLTRAGEGSVEVRC